MNFPSPIILKMSQSTLCVHFMLLLPSVDLFFTLKVSLPECRVLPKFAPESLTKCFTWAIWFISIVMDFDMNLNKHSRNTVFVHPTLTKMAAPRSSMLAIALSQPYDILGACIFHTQPQTVPQDLHQQKTPFTIMIL